MFARMYAKKKRPLMMLHRGKDDGGDDADVRGVMPRPPAPPYAQAQSHARSTRQSSAKGEPRYPRDSVDAKKRSADAYYGADPHALAFAGGARGGGRGGAATRHECVRGEDSDGGGSEEYDEYDEYDDEIPQLLRPRRRFVRSGMTTYEQWISRNAMGRRFNRRSSSLGPNHQGHAEQQAHADSNENDPSVDNGKPESPDASGVSSLSSALKEVLHSRPTALRSVVDPTAGPPREQRSYVVEQSPDGDYFVASRRVPGNGVAVRRVMDDSFIGQGRELQVHTAAAGATSNSEFGVHQDAARLGRRSEMDFTYRNRWGTASTTSSAGSEVLSAHGASPATSSVAGVIGVARRRLSNADRATSAPILTSGASRKSRGSSHGRGQHGGYGPAVAAPVVPTGRAMASPPAVIVMRSSSSRDSSQRASQKFLNQMASKYMDHMRRRSNSGARPRNPSTTAMLESRSFEAEDPFPMLAVEAAIAEQKRKMSVDQGPMTMDEFFGSPPVPTPVAPQSPVAQLAPVPPPLPPARTTSLKGPSTAGMASFTAKVTNVDDDEEVDDNALMNSFRNLRDVDLLKRSKSLSIDKTEPETETIQEETETEEEYPDYGDERHTDDYSSGGEDSDARGSNIAEFLGGFRSRSSMNRNSLGRTSLGRNSLGRNSLGRKDDYASRAARSLHKSRKAVAETVRISTELARKLREARSRIPIEFRDDLGAPPPKKKRGFLSHQKKKNVRFDMTRYCREFEVVEPEDSDDDTEVKRWQQRESELDDDDDDDASSDHSDYEGDIGVPIPGPVLAAAAAEGDAYFSGSSSSAMSIGPGPASLGGDDKRVSVITRKSHSNQSEIFL